MTRTEFVTLTGFKPMPEEYEEIEQAYYLFDGGKEDFCAAFVSGGEAERLYKARAVTIEQLQGKILELDRMVRQAAGK